MFGVVAALVAIAAPPLSAVEDAAPIEELVVTGTRLKTGDPTARLDTITAADIAARGIASTEELIRSIPQNFSTINSGNNLAIDFALDTNLGPEGHGVATANLRGLGSGNTLVLVNGRRIAGAPGASEFFANIRDIPLGAIERVEVYLDGGSSVYGSDAIAGVVNIVLKSEYRGVQATARVEQSNNGGDQRYFTAYAGQRWGSGNVSGTISLTESDPVTNALTGFTTRDWRRRFEGDAAYDFRSSFAARAGLVGLSRWGPFNLILPRGHNGLNTTPEDFSPATPDDYLDYVPTDAGGATEDTSVTLRFAQELPAGLRAHGEVLWTDADTTTRGGSLSKVVPVPASNAFNPFGQTVYVSYSPLAEIRSGLLPDIYRASRTEQLRYIVGLEYAATDAVELVAEYSRSREEGTGLLFNFGIQADPFNADPVRDARIGALLASDDPDEAVNLFGDGSAQNPTIAELLIPVNSYEDATANDSLTLFARGDLWQLPGGAVGFAIGGERRREWLEDQGDNLRFLGVARPTRKLTAAYVELLLPAIGEANRRTAAAALAFTLQARYDRYRVAGAEGNETPGDPSSPPRLVQARFANLSPRLGASWRPSDELQVRVSWSESFRAPTFGDLFGTFFINRAPSDFVTDPLAQTRFVTALSTFGSNPMLGPERSTNTNLNVEYEPAWGRGLRLNVGLSNIDYRDRIATSSELGRLLPPEVYGNLPEIFVRDETGTLLEKISRPVNISRRVSRTLDMTVVLPIDTAVGTLTPQLVYHRVLAQYDQAIAGAAKAGFVGEQVGVDRYRLRAELRWEKEPFAANVIAHHTPGYLGNFYEATTFDVPNSDVGSNTTVDATASYRFGNDLAVRAGGRNVFDREFPFALSGAGTPFDAKRVDVRGRVLFVEISWERSL